MPTLSKQIAAELARCADPRRAELGLARLEEASPGATERLVASAQLLSVTVRAMAASPFLSRICATDPMALDVLEALDRPVGPLLPLERWKKLELLRIAAADLSARTALEEVGAALADLADGILQAAAVETGVASKLAIVAMGKLGARELNYGSDIDIVLVGSADALAFLDQVRQAWRVDVALRPEGRAGPLARTLASYEAYWDRWAETWEFQALLKARAAAGDIELGKAFEAAAAQRLWGRPLSADDLRSLRAMKARAEELLARRAAPRREIKLGPGGIRDIEFAVQLLQLVHGRHDEALRARATLPALGALAAGGYVAQPDASALAEAYRYLRTVEHRLQLFEDRPVHALPDDPDRRSHLARVLGYVDGAGGTALASFEADLARHQALARSIHQRLFFRPLLEAFTADRTKTANSTSSGPSFVSERLKAFGFSDARRTKDAVIELTQGFSRTSRLMQAMVPLLLDWLSEAPDPDLGLLGLRRLATGQHRRARLTALFRESPEAARRLCLLLGTGPAFTVGYERHPDQLGLLQSGPPRSPSRAELEARALQSTLWRSPDELWQGLSHFQQGELLNIEARDVLGLADLAETERCLTVLAESVLSVALRAVGTSASASSSTTGEAAGALSLPGAAGALSLPGTAVIAMGRFGGAELSYGSDLDVIFVFDDHQVAPELAEATAEKLLELMNGKTPAHRLYELDMRLRPEGSKGALARSLRAFEAYYRNWAEVWERQALLRGRFVAGDPVVGERYGDLARAFLWEAPLSADELRQVRMIKARMERERVPAGEDPTFHLKLGPGSLSDVEWTVQLLQLQHRVSAEGTLDALAALVSAGHVSQHDAQALAEAYRFCEAARNRLYLVRSRPGSSLPTAGHQLTVLARSMGTTAPQLRDHYRRLTRRARRVVERLFYGNG
ncbi:MAG: bifunctional [glutamine synthetase] adenylyltransferase/[glutamine synthetase]-adenylyl-L-tyrosine phosphorylase [Acidimicrobiales bacterium]